MSDILTIPVNDKAYASGVLKQGVHERLVADIDNYAADAGIPPEWIYKPLAETCGPAEVKWVTRFHFHKLDGTSGLVLTGNKDVDMADRMSAMAGALVRNFIRARVVTTSQLLDEIEAGVAPNYTCVLIPNFYIGKHNGGHVPEWRAALLLDYLLARHVAKKQTVLSVTNFSNMTQEYGSGFTQLLQKSYQTINV